MRFSFPLFPFVPADEFQLPPAPVSVDQPHATFPLADLLPELRGEVLSRAPLLALALLAFTSKHHLETLGPVFLRRTVDLLVLAAAEGSVAIIEDLLSHSHPHMFLPAKDMISVALLQGHLHVVDWVINQEDVSIYHTRAMSLSEIAAQNGKWEAIEKAIEVGERFRGFLSKDRCRALTRSAAFAGAVGRANLELIGEMKERWGDSVFDSAGSKRFVPLVGTITWTCSQELIDTLASLYGFSFDNLPEHAKTSPQIDGSKPNALAFLRMLVENHGFSLSFNLISSALAADNRALLDYLLAHDCPLPALHKVFLSYTPRYQEIFSFYLEHASSLGERFDFTDFLDSLPSLSDLHPAIPFLHHKGKLSIGRDPDSEIVEVPPNTKPHSAIFSFLLAHGYPLLSEFGDVLFDKMFLLDSPLLLKDAILLFNYKPFPEIISLDERPLACMHYLLASGKLDQNLFNPLTVLKNCFSAPVNYEAPSPDLLRFFVAHELYPDPSIFKELSFTVEDAPRTLKILLPHAEKIGFSERSIPVKEDQIDSNGAPPRVLRVLQQYGFVYTVQPAAVDSKEDDYSAEAD